MASAKIGKVTMPRMPAPKLSAKALGAKPTGQSFEERQAAGRKEIAFWVDEEDHALIGRLQEKLGVKYPKQVLVQALRELAAKEGLV